MVHELKLDPCFFAAHLAGSKTFEVRKNDRDFQVDDELHLKETRYSSLEMAAGASLVYTGRVIAVVVAYITHGPSFGIRDGFCVMAVEQM